MISVAGCPALSPFESEMRMRGAHPDLLGWEGSSLGKRSYHRAPGSSPKNAPYTKRQDRNYRRPQSQPPSGPNINLPQAFRIADHLRPRNKAIRKRELQNAEQTAARCHDESHRAFNHRQPREPSAARSFDRSFSLSFGTHKLRWHSSRCSRSIGVHSERRVQHIEQLLRFSQTQSGQKPLN
jgi:hypothetical protein